MDAKKAIPLTKHLQELRRRLLVCAASLVFFSLVCYGKTDILLARLTSPLPSPLIFISPAEAFWTELKLAFLGGIIFSWPVLLWQSWRFLAPGLKRAELFWGKVVLWGGCAAFWGGVFFAYRVLLPLGVRFLVTERALPVQAMLTVGEYTSFASNLLLGAGVVFTLPTLLIALVKTGLLDPGLIRRGRRHVYVIVFVLAALLSPPDVISQFLLALPLLALYETTVLISRLSFPGANS